MEIKNGRLVKLYVGDGNKPIDRELLADVVADYFPGATIKGAFGLWHGDLEYSSIIELFIGESAPEFFNVQQLRTKLKEVFDQECVGLVILEAEGEF